MKDSSGSIPADRNSCNMNSNINLTLGASGPARRPDQR